MKKISIFIGILAMGLSSLVLATESQNNQKNNQVLQMAQQGCHKPLGFFPTPSKIMCILNTFGLPEKEVKSKAIALVFMTCRGNILVSPPAGITPKRYETLGTCLSDPNAITLINQGLKSQGFTEVKVVNPTILKTTTLEAKSS